MNILHIGFVKDEKTNGIRVVLPQYINYQNDIENVAFYNCKRINIENEIKGVFLDIRKYKKFDIEQFIEPFNKPDIVVFHGVFYIGYMNIYKKLISRNIPYIIVPHSSLTKNALNTKKIKKLIARKIFFDRFIYNAKAIHYLSEYEKTNSKIELPCFIQPNGIKTNYIKRKKFSIDGINIVFIGRKDIHQKGLDRLIEASSLIKQDLLDNNVKINLYGPNHKNGDDIIDKLIKENDLDKIITNNNKILGDEKEKVLKNTDVFVMLSRFEGHSVALLEALAASIPVFVTKGTGTYEEVEKNNCGWTTGDSIEEIANGILKIIKEKNQLDTKSINAFTYVDKTYKWSLISQNMVKEYRKLI